MKEIELLFDNQPKQDLLQKKVENVYFKNGEYIHRYLGFGGAMGGSKSRGLRDAILRECFRVPGINTIIMRRTRQQVYDNQVNPLLTERPYLRAYFNQTKNQLMVPTSPPSYINFGFAEDNDDIFKFQGPEFDIIGLDEAQQFTQVQIEFMQTRNRTSTGSKYLYPKMILGFNPGGISHNYLKRIFIDKLTNSEYENPDDYYFIQSFVWDNFKHVEAWAERHHVSADQYYALPEEERKEITLKNSVYARNLAAKPEHIRKAYLYGDWNTFVGQFFSRYWSGIHEVPMPDLEKDEWSINGAIDYGTDTICEIIATNTKGNTYVVGELAFHDRSLGAEYKAHRLKEFLDDHKWGDITVVGDRNMWGGSNQDIMTDKKIADYYLEAGINLVHISRTGGEGSKGFREICNEAIQGALYWERDGDEIIHQPKLFFVREKCPELCQSLPQLLIHDTKLEDIADGQNDHPYDALKMAYMWNYAPMQKLVQEALQLTQRNYVQEYDDGEGTTAELDGVRF